MSEKLTDLELLEQGLVIGTREEVMQYHQAYKRYGTSQKHPVDAIFDMFESKGVIVCGNGHINKTDYNFCTECGVKISK